MFENSDADESICGAVTYSLVTLEDNGTYSDYSGTLLDIDEGYKTVRISQVSYTGGDMSIFVKAVNNFNNPVYKEISIVEICGK